MAFINVSSLQTMGNSICQSMTTSISGAVNDHFSTFQNKQSIITKLQALLQILAFYCLKLQTMRSSNATSLLNTQLLPQLHYNVYTHSSQKILIHTVISNDTHTVLEAIQQAITNFNRQHSLSLDGDLCNYQLFAAKSNGNKFREYPALDKGQELSRVKLPVRTKIKEKLSLVVLKLLHLLFRLKKDNLKRLQIKEDLDVFAYTENDTSIFLALYYCQRMHNFEIEAQIGQGSFSEVFRVRRKVDGNIYALKKMKLSHLSTQDRTNCLNQIRLLANISHPNIIQYKEAFFQQDHLCLVTEYAEHGDFLHFMIKRKKQKHPLSEQQVCAWGREMVNGINALHRTSIIHRDIKAANFFIVGQDHKVKLGDMNVSSISKDGMASTKIGTPYYTSPEIWKELPYSFKSDIWSFGCLLYEMVTTQHPFTGRDIAELKQNVLTMKIQPLPSSCSQALKDIIMGCLKLEPEERFSAQELIGNQYIKRMYNQYKQRTMEKSLMNEKEHKMTCIRILKQISLGSAGQVHKTVLPKSKYIQGIQQKHKMSPQNKRDGRNSHKDRLSCDKKKLNPRLLTMYNIYNQKPPGFIYHSRGPVNLSSKAMMIR